MPKNSNDKYRLCYLAKIFEKYSDEEHPLSVGELCDELSQRSTFVTRQTLYKDIEDLRHLGYDISVVRGKKYGYYLRNRPFDLAELKLMVDAVQSAKFIRGQNVGVLIDKIGSLTSVHRAGKLKRQVYIRERSTQFNSEIYENIDLVHEAIAEGVRIKYKYYDWNAEKKRTARHNGKYYLVTPIALIWDDENYYLVAYDTDAGEIKHFRVDKLGKVYLTEEASDNNQKIDTLDLDEYSRQVFGMYGGKSELVTLVCENSLAGVIIDKFGESVTFFKEDEDHFRVSVRVMISPNFFSWIVMFRGKIIIKGPSEVVSSFVSLIKNIADGYSE